MNAFGYCFETFSSTIDMQGMTTPSGLRYMFSLSEPHTGTLSYFSTVPLSNGIEKDFSFVLYWKAPSRMMSIGVPSSKY